MMSLSRPRRLRPLFIQRSKFPIPGNNGESQSTARKLKKICAKHHFLSSLAICLLGCSLQIYQISVQYFSYATVTEIFIKKPNHLVLPAFTFCVPFAQIVDLNRLPPKFATFPEKELRFQAQGAQALQEFLTVEQILSLSPAPFDLAHFVLFKKQNSYEIEWFRNDNDSEVFVKDYFVCYTFGHKGQTDPNFGFESKYINFGRIPGVMMEIYLFKERLRNVKTFRVYLHPRRRKPRGDDDFGLNINRDTRTDNFTIFTITYAKYEEHRLEPPYKSNCKLYLNKDREFESAAHCFDDCLKTRSLAAFNRIPFSVTITRPEKQKAISKYSLIANNTLQEAFDLMEATCCRECSETDCIRESYVPKLASKGISVFSKHYLTLQLHSPQTPDTTIYFHPKLTLSEYTIYVMSLIGIYLGFSCLLGLQFIFKKLL